MREDWTGPLPEDLESSVLQKLKFPVPGDRWPYGPPGWHDSTCYLREGGLYCDCSASNGKEEE